MANVKIKVDPQEKNGVKLNTTATAMTITAVGDIPTGSGGHETIRIINKRTPTIVVEESPSRHEFNPIGEKSSIEIDKSTGISLGRYPAKAYLDGTEYPAMMEVAEETDENDNLVTAYYVMITASSNIIRPMINFVFANGDSKSRSFDLMGFDSYVEEHYQMSYDEWLGDENRPVPVISVDAIIIPDNEFRVIEIDKNEEGTYVFKEEMTMALAQVIGRSEDPTYNDRILYKVNLQAQNGVVIPRYIQAFETETQPIVENDVVVGQKAIVDSETTTMYTRPRVTTRMKNILKLHIELMLTGSSMDDPTISYTITVTETDEEAS